MPILICKRVMFYSQNDELVFFEWLERIGCVQKVEGVGDLIHLKISRRKISDTNLRDILAIFERYKIDLKQLSQFLNDRNKIWFKERPKAFWFKKVFGKA